MNSSNKAPASPPNYSVPFTLRAISDYNRWRILEQIVLAGEPQMVKSLAQTAGISETSCSKHMGVLRDANVVDRGNGGLYHIAPAIRPPPGEYTIDFGFLTLRRTAPLLGGR